MLLDLQKDDLINLVKGTEPSGEDKLQLLRPTALGAYSGAYEKWMWNKYALMKLSDEELLSLYCMIVDAVPLPGTAPPVEEEPS
jgi:hypothetical protein